MCKSHVRSNRVLVQVPLRFIGLNHSKVRHVAKTPAVSLHRLDVSTAIHPKFIRLETLKPRTFSSRDRAAVHDYFRSLHL